MEVALWLSLFATRTVAMQQMAGNFTNFVSSTLSCEGTSTYAFTPLETITVTVDGEYTFSGNGTASDIYYTPPPPCSEVIDPAMSTTFAEESTSTTLPLANSTTSSLLEPAWTTICSTSFYSFNKTGNRGAPYANTTRPTRPPPMTSCTTVPVFNSPFFSASLATSAHSDSAHTEPHSVNPKLSTLPAESVAPPRISAEASKAGDAQRTAITVTVTKKTPVPPSPTAGPNNAGPTFPGGGNDVITPNDKQPPTPQPTPGPTTGPRGINTLDGNNPNNNSLDPPNNGNDNPPPTGGNGNDKTPPSGNNNNNNAQPTKGNGNNNNPPPGDKNTKGQNSNPTGSGNNNNNNNKNPTNENQNNNNNNNNNQNNNSPTAANPNQDQNQNQNNNNNANPTPTPTGNGLGSIINSIFNSPFSTAVPITTSLGPALPTATLIAGVPIQIQNQNSPGPGPGSSSIINVYIGGSNIGLPSGTNRATVTVAGQTFTVAPSAIYAGSTTLTLQRAESISYKPVQAATLPASMITQYGITVTVEPTVAVVSGRTFTIGLNAPEATTVIDSQTITFNSDGVIFPGIGAESTTNANGVVGAVSATTYRPALTTGPAYITTTLGALTLSLDSSEAIVSGTTYRIGAGSLNSVTTAVFDGTTLVFGPSGVVVSGSTTLTPTAPVLTGASESQSQSASAATRVVSSGSGGPTGTSTVTALASGGAGVRIAVPSARACVSNALCVVLLSLAAGTLPLALVL